DGADDGGALAGRVTAEYVHGGRGVVAVDDGHEPALARHVQRIQAEQFAGAADDREDRDGAFVDRDRDPGAAGDLVEYGRDPAPGGVAHHPHGDGVEERGDGVVQG